jgi:hypothetical protein
MNELIGTKFNIDKLLDISFYLFLMSCIVLPTGTMLGINFKIIFLLLFLVLSAISSKSSFIVSLLYCLFPILFYLIIELQFSNMFLQYDKSFSIAQAKDIFVFFLMFYVCIIYASVFCGFDCLLRRVIYFICLCAVLKILILIYASLKNLDVSIVVKDISNFFGTHIMTYDVDSSIISRINFTSDYLISICLFYCVFNLHDNGGSFYKKCLVIFFLVFSAVVSMSRFEWGACSVSVICAILLNYKKKRNFMVVFFIFFVVAILLSSQSVQQVFNKRFDTALVSSSDFERAYQEKNIYSEIVESPILGHGIGYYIPNLLRSDIDKYSYELQIPALVMQLGFLGCFIIMVSIFTPLFLICKRQKLLFTVMHSIVTLMWIWGAFFNPILFSSSAGAAMAALFSIKKLQEAKSY